MNLSNGVEPADPSQPTATNSLIARNRSHTRKRAQGHHIGRGLNCRVASFSASHSVLVSGTTDSAPLSATRKLASVQPQAPRITPAWRR